jgi:HEAT repeat protein
MIQNEVAIDELEDALDDPDPLVRELAILTSIHLHRARALGLADLDQAFESVKRLARIEDPAVIPALVQVVNTPRSGFTRVDSGQSDEGENSRARMVALLRLVELHTPEAKAAVHGRQTDRNKEIATAARKALDLFPGPWKGPLKRKAKKD